MISLRFILVVQLCCLVFGYEFTTFSQMTFPLDMTSDGKTVVGTNIYGEAVLWTYSGGAQVIGEGEFWGVSDYGRIAGSLINDDGKEEAVIFDEGVVTYLGNITGGNSCDAFYSSGLGISSDGTTVVGMGWKDCSVEAFYWNELSGVVGIGQNQGNNTKAQAVSGNGSMVGGWAENNFGTRQSCVWDLDGNLKLIGSLSPWSDAGEVTSFSTDGLKIVGYGASTGENDTEAYIAVENQSVLGGYEFTGLGVPSNFATFNESLAFDISDNDVVVGQYTYGWGPDGIRASIWTEELGTMVDFHYYLQSLGINDLSGWTFLKAHCISADGMIIAGTAVNISGNWVTFIIDLSDELGYYLPGDINADGLVNILDIIDSINVIISGGYQEVIDMNSDGSVDITDIIQIINIVIG